MRRSCTQHYLKVAAILVGVCSVGEPAMAGNVKTQPDLKITLNVYNWAHVDSDTLNRAQQEAERIYRQVGIQTVWIDAAMVLAKRRPLASIFSHPSRPSCPPLEAASRW